MITRRGKYVYKNGLKMTVRQYKKWLKQYSGMMHTDEKGKTRFLTNQERMQFHEKWKQAKGTNE